MSVSIQLKSSRVEELILEKSETDIEKTGFTLEVGTKLPSDDGQHDFFIELRTELQLKEGFIVKISYVSEFITDVEIDNEFRNSNFPRVNAPAIAFPFFRAFISNFLLNAGYEPIILPSINFTKIKEAN
ncbi:preprotein translocase subunit SecB [Acinetobacter sp. ANC 4910]|uniref:protein-export chaperone SecB n=1 Tax=Acinetobacter sp. ANC 4910 TaxID=2529850 RepID=UPI00103D424E|nr:protein-export chaperone SecB [Acinetobacter sp. ANC 4910]TCB37518.1 preprotein translocase subunit SecB [Acinetobacter sp. ANC 4910]